MTHLRQGGFSPEGSVMSKDWYARPVLAVRDAPQSLHFYASKLGFKEDWR